MILGDLQYYQSYQAQDRKSSNARYLWNRHMSLLLRRETVLNVCPSLCARRRANPDDPGGPQRRNGAVEEDCSPENRHAPRLCRSGETMTSEEHVPGGTLSLPSKTMDVIPPYVCHCFPTEPLDS